MNFMEFKPAGQNAPDSGTVTIRWELRPGDVGTIIHMHGWIYFDECGYDHRFEGYVCKTFYQFYESYSPDKDRVWIAESDGMVVGCIAIVGHTAERAQLRWFLLHPDFRGIGLGRALMDAALQYSREKGYRQLFLETTEDQQTAIAMYIKAGFRKVRENPIELWNRNLIEQTYELGLS